VPAPSRRRSDHPGAGRGSRGSDGSRWRARLHQGAGPRGPRRFKEVIESHGRDSAPGDGRWQEATLLLTIALSFCRPLRAPWNAGGAAMCLQGCDPPRGWSGELPGRIVAPAPPHIGTTTRL